jgi:hypothetical protein
MKVFPLAVSLTVQAVLLNVRWAGRRRLLCLDQAAGVADHGRVAELEARVSSWKTPWRCGTLTSRCSSSACGRARAGGHTSPQNGFGSSGCASTSGSHGGGFGRCSACPDPASIDGSSRCAKGSSAGVVDAQSQRTGRLRRSPLSSGRSSARTRHGVVIGLRWRSGQWASSYRRQRSETLSSERVPSSRHRQYRPRRDAAGVLSESQPSAPIVRGPWTRRASTAGASGPPGCWWW